MAKATAPARIWLQRDTHGEVTWCSERINDDDDDDVEYVRAPAEATERCSFPGCGAASTGKLDGSVPLCDEHARVVGIPAAGEPPGADAAVREAWRSVTDSLPQPGAHVLAGYRDTAGRWRSVRAVYAADRRWYEIAVNADDVSAWRIGGTVTHWMPLPTAPGAPEEG